MSEYEEDAQHDYWYKVLRVEELKNKLAQERKRSKRLAEGLEFYADRNNWTDIDNWPTKEPGRIVLDRAKIEEKDIPGWTEAKEALREYEEKK